MTGLCGMPQYGHENTCSATVPLSAIRGYLTTAAKDSILVCMNWNEFNLILYIIAFAVGSMNICLSILYHLRKGYDWSKYYLIFQGTVTSILLISAVRMYTSSILQYDSAAFSLASSWLLYLAVAFMIYFIPYFTTWVIAHPWRNPYKSVFLVLSICFLILIILGTIFGFTVVIRLLMILIFFGDFIFCLGVIIKNLSGIKDRDARMISTSFIILSAFMIPFLIMDLLMTFESLASLPIYYFWFSLIILVYLFNYFHHIPETKGTFIDEQKLHAYHITDRESEVIRLIQQGFTSKEISLHLDISTSTVNNHISNIYNKTHVSSRIDLLNLLSC